MRIPIAAVLACAFLSGCAFHAPHDAVAAANIQQLIWRTDEVIADADAGRLTLAESQQFLRVSKAQTQILRTRTSELPGSKEIVTRLDSLEEEYDNLLARNRLLRRNAAPELLSRLFAVETLLPVRIAGIAKVPSESSSDPFPDPCPDDSESKKKDDQCKKDGHDHHGRECRSDRR